MIPIKIKIKNFLSYGNSLQEIDFKDYPLICLSGKNGNGKSALLDAMTWALWGEARKTTATIKADSGLIHLGQTQMMVALEFNFNGSLYNVRREYTKTYGKPLVALDFELFDESKDKFITLTEKTIRQTQEKIENLIGLDFETFSNTAFLRQGQANEFSKKSPKERKQILANILGLDKYEKLKQLAAEKEKRLSDDAKLLNNILQTSKEEITKEEKIKQEDGQESKKLKDINHDLSKKQEVILDLEKENLVFQEQQRTFLNLEKETEELKGICLAKESDFMPLVSKWKLAHYKSLKHESLDELEKLKNNLAAENKALLKAQQENLNIQAELLKKKSEYQKESNLFQSTLEQEIYRIKLDLEKELLNKKQAEILSEQKDKSIIELENKIKNHQKELLRFEENLRNQNDFISKLEKVKSQFEKRRSYYQVIIQRGNHLKLQIKDIQQKSETIKIHESPACPLCQQLLTISRKKFLADKFKISDKFFNHQMDKVSRILKKLKIVLLDQHKQLQNMQKTEEEYKKILIKKEELFKTIELIKLEIKKEKKLFEELNLKIKEAILKARIIQNNLTEKEKELKKGIENNLKLKQISEALLELEKSLEKNKYDKRAHEKLQKDLQKVEERLSDLKSLGGELSKQQERRYKISLFVAQLKEIKNQLKNKEIKKKELNFDEKKIKDLAQKITNGKKEIADVLKEKDFLLQKLGQLKNELDRIKNLKIEIQQKEKKINKINEEIQYYDFLVKTFSKDGLQALLIEQAIPEIEEEANKILSRLTDNQSQIFFESLRDLKKGGVKETLDIQISDSIGMRPYEMFSGGEAFRVDFALRIAISKLLARRAGTPLQTLIIDEGFGSQDEEGLSRLMDSIYVIQQDFAKIIVVSHLSIFKDNFPIHFIVDKTSSGSFINIEERG
ncbi:MAG: SMC family ATPase [bacterium]